MQVHEAPQVRACIYDQDFAFDFTYVQLMIDARSYCNWQLDIH